MMRLSRAFVLALCAAAAPAVGAQEVPHTLLFLYQRAERYVEADDLPALRALSDSVAALSVPDADLRLFGGLLQAWVLRKSGKATAAYHVLDSLSLDPVHTDYALHFAMADQRARVLKDLMLYSEAWTESDRALQFAKAYGLVEEQARMLVIRAEASWHLAHYDDALSDLIAAEQLAERAGLEHLRCTIEIDRGNVLFNQKRTAEALEHYRLACDLAKAHHMMAAYKNALFNVASATFDEGRDEAAANAAIAILDRALGQFSNDPALAADIHLNAAVFLEGIDDDTHALLRMRKSMDIREQLGDTNGLASEAIFLSSILWNLGQREEALRALQRSTDLALRTGDLQLTCDAEVKAYEYMKSLGRIPEALLHLESHMAAKDSLNTLAREQRAADLEIQYGTAKKERALRAKDVELTDANAAKRRREVQLLWSVGAALMLATLLLLLFRNNQHSKRLREKDRVVHAQEVNDLMRQQEIRSLDAMMEGQERERKRVAQDLHDRLGSMLSAIKLQFSALEGRMEQLRRDQKQQYDHVFTLLDDAVGEVRRISHDMVKSSLTRFGLKGALEDLYSTVHVPGKLEIEMSLFGLDDRLEQRVEIAIYRMVQESINNALRHARARHITVQVTRSTGMLNLMVEDDGVGFDPTQVSEGMGMGNLRRRAAEIGGTVRIDTRPGRGTSISVDVPLTPSLPTT